VNFCDSYHEQLIGCGRRCIDSSGSTQCGNLDPEIVYTYVAQAATSLGINGHNRAQGTEGTYTRQSCALAKLSI